MPFLKTEKVSKSISIFLHFAHSLTLVSCITQFKKLLAADLFIFWSYVYFLFGYKKTKYDRFDFK